MILNICYIFLFGSGQPESFAHEPETEPFEFKKMNPTLPEMLIQPNPTQPNPYSSGWVGSGCQVECTLLELNWQFNHKILKGGGGT